jgi:diguanylate cyclase (GGDEF)-like protein
VKPYAGDESKMMSFLSLNQGRVLIVDDDSLFLRAMVRELNDEDFALLTAESGDQALELVRTTSVDVVIVDLKMPGMSGLDFVAQAREILSYETRYLLMTGWGELNSAVAAMRLGVVDYLTKPFDTDLLLSRIQSALSDIGQIRQQQRQQLDDCRKNALIFSTVQTGLLLIERDSNRISDANNAACTMLGEDHDKLISLSWQSFFLPGTILSGGDSHFTLSECAKGTEMSIVDRSGLRRPVQISVTGISLDGRDHDLVSFTDISQRKKIEADLEESRETFSAIVECSLDGIIILSMHGQILFINSAGASFYDEPKESLIGRPFGCLVAIGEPMEMNFPPQADSQVIVELRVAESRWKGEPALVVTLRDITERKKLENSIRHMATHDELTGLANRNLLPLQMMSILALARRNQTQAAVLFIDLDNFKPINDNFGHAVGDIVLKEIAERLTSGLRASDLVARVGGDEFVVVLQEVQCRDVLRVAAERIIKQLSERIQLDGFFCQLGASVGISLFPQDGEKSEELISKADAAMYQVKHRMKNSICFYEPGMELDLDGKIN